MTTPREALALLKEGNARFVGDRVERQGLNQSLATAENPEPFAAILGCMDSRVPPELVLDQGIGDIFSIRIAGNYASDDIVGCFEFAAEVASVSLIVVLGHTDCAAVRGACDGIRLGSFTHTLSHLAPALEKTHPTDGERDSSNKAFVRAVAEQNVRQTLRVLTERSELLRDAVANRTLAIVGAIHDVATGRVTFLDA